MQRPEAMAMAMPILCQEHIQPHADMQDSESSIKPILVPNLELLFLVLAKKKYGRPPKEKSCADSINTTKS